MSEFASAYLQLTIFLIVGGVVLLRLVSAPYFLWKEDQAKIAALQSELGDPNTRLQKLIEERDFADRVAVREFLTRHSVRELAMGKHRYASEFKEVREPLGRLILQDPSITPLADEFIDAHSEVEHWLRIYGQTNQLSRSDMEVLPDMEAPAAVRYYKARKALFDRMAEIKKA